MPQLAKYCYTAAMLILFVALGGLAAHVLSRPPAPGDNYIIGGIAFAFIINIMALKDAWPSKEEEQ